MIARRNDRSLETIFVASDTEMQAFMSNALSQVLFEVTNRMAEAFIKEFGKEILSKVDMVEVVRLSTISVSTMLAEKISKEVVDMETSIDRVKSQI